MPQISVIIPTFNRAKLIGRAILSVLEQSFHDFEIIVIDDGSTDNTKNIINNFNSNKIKYYYINHQGVSAARNFGIKKSNSEYISFLDSDDEFYKNKLQTQIDIFKNNPELSFTFSYADIVDEMDKEYKRIWNIPIKNNIYPNFLLTSNNVIPTPSVMIKRNILYKTGLFNEKMSQCEDLELWSRITRKYKSKQIQSLLVKIHRKNIKRDINYDLKCREILFKIIIAADKSLPNEFKLKLYEDLYLKYGQYSLSQPTITNKKSRELFITSFKYVPKHQLLNKIIVRCHWILLTYINKEIVNKIIFIKNKLF